ncbi:MAG: hypothetical protein CMO80_09820 [Verrucomicrobiales bacterium]|nr:hypothetical protein [Verrucomicrobiales bacterium]
MIALAAAAVIVFESTTNNPALPQVVVRSAPEQGQLTLHLRAPGKLGPPIFADIRRSHGKLILTPRFNLSRGKTYRAILSIPDRPQVVADYTVPRREGLKSPEIVAIWPTTKTVPANLLKFYLHFSKPMREGREIFDQIHIVESNGKRVHSPWRRQELWSEDARRLTLWIHPGRIKQGVNLRERFGPVLMPGHSYKLVLDPSIRCADGLPLGKSHMHEFRAVSEDKQKPLPQAWTLEAPATNSREPLQIKFHEPIDRAMVERHFDLHAPNGNRIQFTAETRSGDAVSLLTPKSPWVSGNHILKVSQYFEDLAGNTRLRIFDRDLTKPSGTKGEATRYFAPVPR